MKTAIPKSPLSGFSILELTAALGIFLVICAAAFTLLGTSQRRFQSDSQVLNSFQEARFGMDQIVRDINDSGFPPPNSFSASAAVTLPYANRFASTPFAWSPGYQTNNPCSVGTPSCVTPSDFDLIVETSLTPQVPNSPVYWVRYQLDSTNTLKRGAVPKQSGQDPVSVFEASDMVPYIQNVMNNASPSQIAQFRTAYPTMFPSGNAVPIFSYFCDISGTPQPCSSPNNSPKNIRSVSITLIVMAATADAQSGQPRLVELNGLGRRINPN